MTWITPIKPPHLDGSLGSFTMPATFSVPAGCLNASEEFTRWAANYGMIAVVMWTSSSPKGQSSQCSIQKSRISSAVSFLVPKNTGDLCPVIHLSHLNGYLVIPQFKMETQASVRSSIRESKWTMSIDIPDAYLHLPMARPAWKYLWFMVNGRVYQFSLAISPWEFTKAVWWLQGVSSMFTWTVGLSAPPPLYRPELMPIWSTSVAAPTLGDQFQRVWFATQPAIQFQQHAIQYVYLHHPCPNWGSKSRTRWITGDRTLASLPGISTDFWACWPLWQP